MNIESILGAVSHLGTGWILWLLIAFSVIGTAIVIERGVCYWTTLDDIPKLSDALLPLIRDRNWGKAARLLSESPSYEARVAAASLHQPNAESADQHMQSASELARLELERHLGFLGTLGSNAPFVGLLGTVIGIVNAFRQLDASSGALTEGLMSEIGEALIATAAGLLVALPAIAAFNLFRRVVQTRVTRADALRRSVLGSFQQTAGDQ